MYQNESGNMNHAVRKILFIIVKNVAQKSELANNKHAILSLITLQQCKMTLPTGYL